MLHDAGITAKLIRLELTVKICMSLEDMEKYEELDQVITKCMTRVVKKVQETIYGKSAILTGTTQSSELN